jgi:hypothetical protein
MYVTIIFNRLSIIFVSALLIFNMERTLTSTYHAVQDPQGSDGSFQCAQRSAVGYLSSGLRQSEDIIDYR